MSEGTVILVVGIIFSVTGLLIFIINISLFIRCSVRTDATIDLLKKEKTARIRTVNVYKYRPSFEYKAGGTSYHEQAPFTVRLNKYQEGDSLRIYYNPKNPQEVCFKNRISPFIWGLAFLALGVFNLVVFFL